MVIRLAIKINMHDDYDAHFNVPNHVILLIQCTHGTVTEITRYFHAQKIEAGGGEFLGSMIMMIREIVTGNEQVFFGPKLWLLMCLESYLRYCVSIKSCKLDCHSLSSYNVLQACYDTKTSILYYTYHV